MSRRKSLRPPGASLIVYLADPSIKDEIEVEAKKRNRSTSAFVAYILKLFLKENNEKSKTEI